MSRKGIHRKKRFTVPVAVILGFMPLVGKAVSDVQAGGWSNLRATVPALIPYDPVNRRIDFSQMGLGTYPIIAGILAHKIIGGILGVNRVLSRAGVPWIRI